MLRISKIFRNFVMPKLERNLLRFQPAMWALFVISHYSS